MTEMQITIDVIARDAFHDRFMHSADIFRGGEHVCKTYTWNIKRKPDDNAKLNSAWLFGNFDECQELSRKRR